MNFTQERSEQQNMMPTNEKGSAGQELGKGTQQIKKVAAKAAARPEVRAATQAAKDGAKKAKDTVLGLFGMGDESPQKPQLKQQQQTTYSGMGGKRRRKSRRKKRRTKRRRKSRRKRRR